MFFGKRFSGYRKGTLSGLDVLVLSIIKTNDGITGYELIQSINEKFKDLWKASAGTIYPLLTRLTKKELLDVRKITENNREKKLYSISQKGKSAFREVLELNLEPSMSTLGDYIKTVLGALPFEQRISNAFHCFPFCDIKMDEKIDKTDFSLENIERIKNVIENLEKSRIHLTNRTQSIEEKIDELKSILTDIMLERDKKAKPIEIIDDDEEFENF